MTHLRPGHVAGHNEDDGADLIVKTNSKLGQSYDVEFSTLIPRIPGNHDRLLNSSGIKSSNLAGRISRYYYTSGGGSESGILYQKISRHYESFGSSKGDGLEAVTQSTSRDFDGFGHLGGIEFHAKSQSEEDSDVSSPPLWNPTTKVSSFPQSPHLSPTSRLQAIARGRQELMEMIQDMPESAYELSLKDLVESPVTREAERTAKDEETALVRETIQEERKKGRGGRRRNLKRGNMDNGAFLLKMFFPASLGSKRRISGSGILSSKVSPKPIPVDEKKVDGEWWKKRFSVGGDSDHSRTSKNSRNSSISSSNSSNSSRHLVGILASCWSLFRRNKYKGIEQKGCLF